MFSYRHKVLLLGFSIQTFLQKSTHQFCSRTLRVFHFCTKPIIVITILLLYYPMIYLQGTTWFSPQVTLGSWMLTRGLEHVACGAGTTHRMETRPVATHQHQAYEESYRSTDWCGHSSPVWVTRVGRVCWHAWYYSWHPGKFDCWSSESGFSAFTALKTDLWYNMCYQRQVVWLYNQFAPNHTHYQTLCCFVKLDRLSPIN